MAGRITFQSAENPARWFQHSSNLFSSFWRIACSALGLVKVKVSKGDRDWLSEKFSIKGTIGDEYYGKYVFVVSALIGNASICSLPFLENNREQMYRGKFNVPADVLLTVMTRVRKGVALTVVSDDEENQEFITRLLHAVYKQGALKLDSLHAVIAQILGECLDDILPADLRAEWEPVDSNEPLALMVKGSRKILDDQFPDGEDWAFLKDPEALREHCIDAGDPESEGAPTTPTQAGDGSFAFGPPVAQPPAARDLRARDHGKQLRPPPSAGSGEESESSDSDDGEDDSDSGDSGPPPPRPRQPAAPNAGRTDIARVLARHGLTIEECRNPKKLGIKRGFVKQNAIDALCDLAVGGHAAQAPEGGTGPGASIAPVEGASMVSEFTKAMTKQTVEFRRAVTKQTDAMVGLQKETLNHLAGQTEKHVNGYVRLALGFNKKGAPNAIEERLPRSDSGESGKKRKDPSSRFVEEVVPKKASSRDRSGDSG